MSWRQRVRRLFARRERSGPGGSVQGVVAVPLTSQAEKVAVSGEAARLAARLERVKLEAGIYH